MLQDFNSHIQAKFPFLADSNLLIACSGGIDSTVLSYLCMKIGLRIGLAHCNFKLREFESDKDENFVRAFGEKNKIPVFVKSFEAQNYGKVQRLSTQMAARELRYNWFRELLATEDYDFVLTGHHANDNLETFIINLTRGSGLEGLTGIPEQNEHYIRPLLPFTRAAIEAYAHAHFITWREDSSNQKTNYLRNKIRHTVIPALEDLNPALLENFKKSIRYVKDSSVIVSDTIKRLQDEIFTTDSEDDHIIRISIANIKALGNDRSYIYYLLKDFGFTAWEDVIRLLDGQAGKQIVSDTHRLVKDRTELLLTPIREKIADGVYQIQEGDSAIILPHRVLKVKNAKMLEANGKKVIFVDKQKLKYPLSVRRWKQGDVFRPFGMEGTKKLSKYFKDEKLSLLEKEKVWVLCSENQIVWVVGYRADERFKVSVATRNIIKISIT